MPVEVQSLFELDAATVQQRKAALAQMIAESHPSLDTRRGAFSDLVLAPAAALATARAEDISRYRRSTSLSELTADPSLGDNDDVDAVLANFLIERREGTAASGPVTIVVSRLATVSVVGGSVFEANGQQFQATQAFTGRASSQAVAGSGDRVLSPLGDGTYAFTISVEAVTAGTDGLLRKDTLLVPQSSILNFVKAYAAADFTGGSNTQTNAELTAQLQTGYAAKALSNRVNMLASLLTVSEFAGIVSSSIIGYGDAEQLRDKHSLLPGAFGGRVDWYLRTQEMPQRKGITKTALLVEKHSDNRGVWELQLQANDAPGYYDVISIVPAAIGNFSGTLPVVSHVRSNDLAAIPGELSPDLQTSAEGVFTRYQKGVIRFKDTETDTSSLSLGAEGEYAVTVRGMPLLDALQSYLGGRGVRFCAGDVLVKAPVPCFVSLAFTLEGKPGAAIPDVAALAADIAGMVNRTGFSGRLYAARVADLIHNAVGNESVSVGAIQMLGQILRPDGTLRTLSSTHSLIVPSEPEVMQTSRTVCFMLDPDDVRISVATVPIPQLA